MVAQEPFTGLDDPPGTYALITDLAVLSNNRNQGIGRRLLQQAESSARAERATELRIGVLTENTGARRLYLDTAFVPHLEILAKRLCDSHTPENGGDHDQTTYVEEHKADCWGLRSRDRSCSNLAHRVREVGFGDQASPERRADAQDEVYRMWQKVREPFLAELDVEVPTHHHAAYVAVSPQP